MKQQVSPGVVAAIMAVVLVIIAVIAWKVVSPTPSGPGPDMMHWDPNKVPASVRGHLKEMQSRGAKPIPS